MKANRRRKVVGSLLLREQFLRTLYSYMCFMKAIDVKRLDSRPAELIDHQRPYDDRPAFVFVLLWSSSSLLESLHTNMGSLRRERDSCARAVSKLRESGQTTSE